MVKQYHSVGWRENPHRLFIFPPDPLRIFKHHFYFQRWNERKIIWNKAQRNCTCVQQLFLVCWGSFSNADFCDCWKNCRNGITKFSKESAREKSVLEEDPCTSLLLLMHVGTISPQIIPTYVDQFRSKPSALKLVNFILHRHNCLWNVAPSSLLQLNNLHLS